MPEELQPIDEKDYLPIKPQEQKRREYSIRQSLLEQGHSREMADAVIGYTIDDIPFVYKDQPQEVEDGNSKRPLLSELWIGTSDAVYNLDAEWLDQIPEVILQWRGITKLDEEGTPKEVTRNEVHQLKDGSFVEVEYQNVSEMGEFDGEIARISLNVPEGTFRPWGGPRERKSYRIYYFRRMKPTYPMTDVPGGNLLCKGGKEYEWTLDLTHSNVTGTTILNGFSEMVQFKMDKINALKEDTEKAFRYTPLPEPSPKSLLTSGIEEEHATLLHEATEERREIIESLFPRAKEMMTALAPVVRDILATGAFSHQTQSMAVDGILKHPEKISLLGHRLTEVSREMRFRLAQEVVGAIKVGSFREWLEKLKGGEMERLTEDVANRNAYHLLNWFMRTAPEDADLSEWVAKTEKVIFSLAKGEKVPSNQEYERCFDGMCTSFVERFIEFLGQQYLGNTLA
jgi:hypothetical protein